VRKAKIIILAVVIALISGSIASPAASSPHPIPPIKNTIVVMAYNIHQGFDMDFHWNFDMAADVIEKIDPDIIGLSESDSCRISSGNEDVVRYLADKLNMYSYFGPKTLSGTWGIALLSRYPIVDAKTYYMPSIFDQICIIEAKVVINNALYNIYVTHFGSEEGAQGDYERIMHANFTRDLANTKTKTVVMGDFNLEPTDYYYAYLTEHLQNAWYAVHPSGVDENGYSGYTFDWKNPAEEIDMILYSRDMVPVKCWVPTWAHASDHMPICATFDLSQSH